MGGEKFYVRRWLALLLCGVGMVCGAGGQDLRYLRHQAWSTEDGLPQDSVHAIYQAGDGFLWVATEGGIARFDGFAFQVFNHVKEAAFLSDDACCLAGGADGSVWIGTGDGVVRYRDGRFVRYGVREGLPSAVVRELTSGRDGGLVVGTADGVGVWADGRFVRGAGEVGGTREGLVVGADGKRWEFSASAVREGGRTWRVGVDLPGSRVETVFVDRGGSAWIGTNDGLAVVSPGSGKALAVEALRGSAMLQVFEDAEGDVWVGTETSGLHVLRQARFRTVSGLADKALTAVVEGSDGSVWVGTRKDGLLRVRSGVVDEPVATGELTSPFILSLAPGEAGSVWVGTPDGLNHVSAGGAVERITSAEGLPDDYILSLAAGRDGVMWVGTRHGLVRLAGKRMDVLTTADGLMGDLIGALMVGRGGEVWIGSSGGLSRRGVDGVVTRAGGMAVSSIAEDGAGTVWVAYRDGGLGRVAGGQMQACQCGVAGGKYAGLMVEGGSLLLRDEKGMERVALAELNRGFDGGQGEVRLRRYGMADGMPSVEVVTGGSPVFWRMRDGELWTTTRRGVAVVDPRRLERVRAAPPVVIERLLVDEAVVAEGAAVPYGRRRYTVEYAGLSYAAPTEVQYQVRLEGLEAGWTEAGNRRTATYTNLPPGEYRFRVQARSEDGVWGEAGASVGFRVVPPFYRRWWFLGLIGVVAVGLGAGVYGLRLRRLRGQYDAVLLERNRMAREIHDTLAQDFVGVTLHLDIVAQMLGASKVDAAMEQVRATRRLVTEGLAEARQSIWGLRANLTQDSLPTRLGKVVERYGVAPLKVQTKIGGAYRVLDGRVEGEVLRVAQECLANVQRHAGAGKACVELHYGGDKLVLTVEDDGRGFVVEEGLAAAGHYGLSGLEERAAAVGGRLEIVSGPGAGTKVRLMVPIAGVEG